jgi:8-oxo-dGTP pyrophosphatase MutT (NUDIX family)
MDLTIDFPGENFSERLNIRVVVLAKTKKGLIFEKHPKGYIYCMGGRVKLNETSLDAAKRETLEEIGVSTDLFKFRGMIENFYSQDNCMVHEINFVYEITEILEIKLSENFEEVPEEELQNKAIKPEILKDFILDKTEIKNYINK